MQEISTNVLIIGAGPSGLFSVFMCGMMGIKACVLDGLSFIGGQCQALYPEKPIYDIPGFKSITGQELIGRLQEQASSFNPTFYLGEKAGFLEKTENGFIVTTDQQRRFFTKTIIICAGAGAFVPKKPPLPGIESFEDKSVFYHVHQKEFFREKTVVIAGGGDSAVDWAVELSEIAKQIFLVHRRNQFRAQEGTLSLLARCFEKGTVKLYAPYQLEGLHANDEGNLQTVSLIDFSDEIIHLKADVLLPFFGMSSELGALETWGLRLEKNRICVHETTFETSVKGIYAVGDVALYPNKLKLITTGFAEAASAAHDLRRYVWPDRLHSFQHSTTTGIPNACV